MEQAATLNDICLEEAQQLEFVFSMFFIWHLVTFVACIYREVYSGSISKCGQLMRILEIACLVCYLGTILMALEAISLALVREHSDDPAADLDPISMDDYNELIMMEGVKKSFIFLAMRCSRSDFQSF